jgi:hypothetical protein
VLAEDADILILTETMVNTRFDCHPMLYPVRSVASSIALFTKTNQIEF